MPLERGESLTLSALSDYAALIPPTLPDTFTAKEFSKAARLQGRNLSGALKVLLATDALRREKQGKTWLYSR